MEADLPPPLSPYATALRARLPAIIGAYLASRDIRKVQHKLLHEVGACVRVLARVRVPVR